MGFLYRRKMKVKLFNYELPENLIAQRPVIPRDSSRLLVVNPDKKTMKDKKFYNVESYLKKGDILVINNSKVIPARLFGQKKSGSTIEILLLKRLEEDIWETLVKPGRRFKIGDRIKFSDKLRATCLDIVEDGKRIIQFYYEGIFEEILDELGEMPLPPYIKVKLESEEMKFYQTIYHKEGESSAAPTAGLHFTKKLLDKLKEKGVVIVPVMLNIGLGTFRPVKVKNIMEHKMHSEHYEITNDSAKIINLALKEKKKIIAVGTTVIRVLESNFQKFGFINAGSYYTDIFITPGFDFKVVDSLITNFHLPESTLIILISAFMGREFTLQVYKEAIKRKYRFFSFGDAMLIDKE